MFYERKSICLQFPFSSVNGDELHTLTNRSVLIQCSGLDLESLQSDNIWLNFKMEDLENNFKLSEQKFKLAQDEI